MNPTNEACRPDRIADFLSGKLTGDECEVFEMHLEQCETCDRAFAAATAEKPFWNDVRMFLKPSDRIASSQGSTADDGHLDQTTYDIHSTEPLNRELKTLLDATDDPRMLGRFGGYEIAGVIGRGGMGLVFKGLDVSLDRFVAIKVLSPSYGSSPAARARFAREAKAAASVVDDHVVAIYGVDEFKGVPYLVMPYVKSESLQQRIDREAPLSLETTLEIAVQVARGLAVAHEQGLVHRDIKPSNILMPSSVSRVQITDFGLARAADDASLTQSGVIAGTPQYMSPEQARGDAVDGRTDQFSLGSVIYAMATGHPPFCSDTTYGTLRRITDETHSPLTQVQPSVPLWLGDIVDRLLSKDPADRFESAAQLADHLEDCLAHCRQPATAVLPKLKVKRQKRRGTLAWIAAAIALVGVSAILVWFGLDQSREMTQQEYLPPWTYDDSELTRIENEVQRIAEELELGR